MDKQSPQPPKWATRFMHWFCAEEVLETLEGDLYELYYRRIEESGNRKANLHFYKDVLDICRPFAWRKRKFGRTNHLDMFKNNLKITLRSLWKNLGSDLLNVTGLTLGVLGSIIIFLTVKYEMSFDTFHQNESQIYRVTNNYYYPTFTMYVGQTPDPMAEALQTDFPEFTKVFPIHSNSNHNISVEQQIFESDIIYCGPEFIQAFDYYNDPSQWIIGNPNDILKEVNKTVLTKTLAEKLFQTVEGAIGKTIVLSNEIPLEVAGVMEDPPSNTNYPFEQLVSYRTRSASESFGGVSATSTFVQLPASVSVESLRPALDQFNKKYMEAAWGEDFVSMDLQALSDIHFDERFGADNYATDKTYLWALGLIGIFIILIACINFVNLATAKAITRSKEIGMRKILGSSKNSIIAQFMTESFLLAFIALCAGTLLAQLSFPYFSELTNLNIGNNFYYSPDLIVFILGLLVFITLAMGLYPAFMLAKFQPLEVFSPKRATASLKGLTVRKGLIAFQLTTSQVLVIAAIVVSYQLQFFQNKDLGFEKESVLIVDINGNEPIDKKMAFKRKIQQFPFVKETTLASSLPMAGHNSSTGLTSKDSEIKERFNVEYIFADNDYVEAMNFEVLAGKTSVIEIEEDTVRGFVVNETLIKRLDFGTAEEALGKSINVHGFDARIMGVVKDFHTLSLHENIKPIAIVYGIRNYQSLGIKYQTDNIRESIAQLETSWKSVFPDKNFDYYFLDEQMANIYDNEVRFSKIINAFTFISILIACLGLIGLSAFTSISRFREIGIRKVLGASVPSILLLISREFIVLTLISFIIGAPIAYYLISSWLEGFAYQIDLAWWMIVSAGIMTLLVTLLTVGLQSIKAAMVNPIVSLRGE